MLSESSPLIVFIGDKTREFVVSFLKRTRTNQPLAQKGEMEIILHLQRDGEQIVMSMTEDGKTVMRGTFEDR
jgi:hypothetical protein